MKIVMDCKVLPIMDNEAMEEKTELGKICTELKSGMDELNTFADRLLRDLSNCDDVQSAGISLMDVKNDTLLSYITNVLYLISKKCSGQQLESDKAIERLVEMRVVLERIKPLEQKLKYQIEKLVKASLTGKSDGNDKTRCKANPDDMVDDFNTSDGSDSEDECLGGDDKVASALKKKKAGLYVPPKLAAVPYDDDNKAMKQKKLMERATKRALNSSVVQELKEQYLDTPVEISHTNTLRNTRMKHEIEKQKYEETYFTRLPITKEEKRKNRLMSTLTLGKLGSDITHFEDISALEGRLPSGSKKRKKSEKTKKSKIKKKRKRIRL